MRIKLIAIQLTNIFHSFLQSVWLVHSHNRLFCLSPTLWWLMWQCQVADEQFMWLDPYTTDRKKNDQELWYLGVLSW